MNLTGNQGRSDGESAAKSGVNLTVIGPMDWTMNDAPAIAAHHLRPVTHFHLNGSKSKFNRTNLIETPTYDSLASLVATHRRLFLDEIHSGFSRSGFLETGFSESCYRIWRDFWEASVSGFFVIFFLANLSYSSLKFLEDFLRITALQGFSLLPLYFHFFL